MGEVGTGSLGKSRNRIAQRQSIRLPTESGMAAIYTGIPTVGEWQAPQVRRVAPPPTRVRGYAVVAGSIVFRRDLLNKPDNSAAQFRVWDTDERLYQSQAIGGGEEIIHVQVRVSNLHSPSRPARHSVEEERNRHLKDLGYVLQPAGANAVGSLLIFLNLLERQSKRVRKSCLAHFEHQAPHPHAAADMPVDGIKTTSRHFGSQGSAIRHQLT
jgi:hypothetical protein